MNNKEILLDRSASARIQIGVNKIANAVSSTLGPKGQNVIIEKDSGEIITTKDGVTVAREIFLADPVENIGAQMIKKVAEKTVKDCGDGTTTSTLLAQCIFNAGIKNISAGAHAMELKKGMDLAVAEVVKFLKENARPVKDSDDIKRIATISANNDRDMGDLIGEAMAIVGNDGMITVEESRTTETSFRVVEGMALDRGWISPGFITDRIKSECVFVDPLILIYDKRIDEIKPLLPLLEKIAKANRPIIIVADGVEGEALSTLVVNNAKRPGGQRAPLQVCCISCPGHGETRKPYLEDLAAITGGVYITEDLGLKLEQVELDQLGTCEKAVIDRWRTQIIGGESNKEQVAQRVETIRGELERSEIPQEQHWLRQRLARLSGGVAIISVGAASEVEMKEKMDRIDDALHATRAAVEEGILPGGGVALLRARAAFENIIINMPSGDQKTGAMIIHHAIDQPLRMIVVDCPEGEDVIIKDLIDGPYEYGRETMNYRKVPPKFDFGYNPLTERTEYFYDTGIIDPAKVIRCCLENACSVAGMLLTSATLIHRVKGDWTPLQGLPMRGPGDGNLPFIQ